MNPPHIPGNEPDSSDMSLEPGDLRDATIPGTDLTEEAAQLGDFA